MQIVTIKNQSARIYQSLPEDALGRSECCARQGGSRRRSGYRPDRQSKISNLGNALVIFALAFIIRIFFSYIVITNGTYLTPDSLDYIRLAKNIAENSVYGLPGSPEIFRVPLYPLLISGFILLFKTHFVSALLISQTIFDSLTAVFVMKIVSFLFMGNSKIIGIVAGILYSLSPLCIVYSTKVLSETFFVFLLIILFILSLKLTNNDCTRTRYSLTLIIFIGLLTGILCLTRAVFVPLTFIFLLWISLRIKKRKYILVLVFFSFLIPGMWIIRNYSVSEYMGITTVAAVNMYRYDACSVLAKIHSINFTEQQLKIDTKLSKISTQKRIAEYCEKKAFSVMKAYPCLYTYLHCRNSISTFIPAVNDLFESFGITVGGRDTLGLINSKGFFEGAKHYFKGRYIILWIALPLTFALFIFYVFALCGIFMIFKKTAKIAVMDHLFIFILMFCFFIAGGAASTPRFRIPLEPFLCIYAAAGIIFLIKLILKKVENIWI